MSDPLAASATRFPLQKGEWGKVITHKIRTMLLLLCRLVDVKIGISFYYDNSTTDNIAPTDIWLVFSENEIHAFVFNTKYNRINITSASTRRFFPSSFPRFQLVSSFYRAYSLIVSCFSRACWMQSIKLFPALTVLRSNVFQTVTIF